MKLNISLEIDNDAFENNLESELARILGTVPGKVMRQLGRDSTCACIHPEADDVLQDINGNTVGTVSLKED